MQQRPGYMRGGMRRIKSRPVTGRWHGAAKAYSIEVIRRLADKYGKTPAQIVIRWHLDCGLVVIRKSVTFPYRATLLSPGFPSR